MSDSCCGHDSQQTPPAESFRKILWVALFINGGMFLVEIVGGWQANSVSLLAEPSIRREGFESQRRSPERIGIRPKLPRRGKLRLVGKFPPQEGDPPSRREGNAKAPH